MHGVKNTCAHLTDMHKIVLDTNCLLQILPSRSKYHNIWISILNGSVSLCVNTDILDEYEEILGNKMTPRIAHNVVEAIARLSTTCYQETYIHFGLIEVDKDDNKFVDCSIAADAKYIVSNDSHFDILKTIEWPQVQVVNIEEYHKELSFSNK